MNRKKVKEQHRRASSQVTGTKKFKEIELFKTNHTLAEYIGPTCLGIIETKVHSQ
jgi:hypothetical protein